MLSKTYSIYTILPGLIFKMRESLAIMTGTTITPLSVPLNVACQLMAQDEPDEESPEI